jgi:hypothetical protein
MPRVMGTWLPSSLIPIPEWLTAVTLSSSTLCSLYLYLNNKENWEQLADCSTFNKRPASFQDLEKGQTSGGYQSEHPEPDLSATPCPRTWRHNTGGPRPPWWQAAVATAGSGGAPSSQTAGCWQSPKEILEYGRRFILNLKMSSPTYYLESQ